MVALKTNSKPIKVIEHYSDYKAMNSERLEKAQKRKEELKNNLIELRKTIDKNKSFYKHTLKVDLECYDEWNKGCYISGRLLKIAKGLFITKGNNFKIASDILTLLKYAKYQQELVEVNKTIELSEKASKIKKFDYFDIVLNYVIQIHKVLLLDAGAYKIGNGLGNVSLIRFKNKGKSKHIVDYNATNKLKREMKERGEQVYDAATAKWCKEHNIPYDIKPVKVLRDRAEYLEAMVHQNARFKDAHNTKFIEADFRNHKTTIGLTNSQLLEKYHNDVTEIVNAPLGVKSKLALLREIKPELFNNYIRYENQENITDWPSNRED